MELWNDGSRPPISFYLSPLSISVFLFWVSIIDELSKRFISKFTYTYVCTSYTRIRTAFICINYILGVKITTHIFSMNRLAVFEFARMQPADRISACVCTCIVCTNFCLYTYVIRAIETTILFHVKPEPNCKSFDFAYVSALLL